MISACILLLLTAQTPDREPPAHATVAALSMAGLSSVDFSPALNLLETVRLRVDPKSGKVTKRRRTEKEQREEKAAGFILRSAQAIAHTLGD